MQLNSISKVIFFLGLLSSAAVNAQVNSVEFGKNRIQHQKFNWKFYQSPNFKLQFGNFRTMKEVTANKKELQRIIKEQVQLIG